MVVVVVVGESHHTYHFHENCAFVFAFCTGVLVVVLYSIIRHDVVV